MIAVFCAVGAYGTTNTPFSLIQLAFFGVLGLLMKVYHYPIAPLVLGMLVGNTADTCLRRALTQYADNIGGMILRPFGLGVMVALVLVFILSIRSDKRARLQARRELRQTACGVSIIPAKTCDGSTLFLAWNHTNERKGITQCLSILPNGMKFARRCSLLLVCLKRTPAWWLIPRLPLIFAVWPLTALSVCRYTVNGFNGG